MADERAVGVVVSERFAQCKYIVDDGIGDDDSVFFGFVASDAAFVPGNPFWIDGECFDDAAGGAFDAADEVDVGADEKRFIFEIVGLGDGDAVIARHACEDGDRRAARIVFWEGGVFLCGRCCASRSA